MAAAVGGREEWNWSLGWWVHDNASRPLYNGLKCFDEVAFDKNGQNDTIASVREHYNGGRVVAFFDGSTPVLALCLAHAGLHASFYRAFDRHLLYADWCPASPAGETEREPPPAVGASPPA
uniref:Uncharacterized protein n=1 Tax=Leersia perrieri TaxID=77586 RepID=A0A0D9WVE8_9ORYZ